ncbi:PHP domain-containing protein [Arthrobacter bambusae]|uniref:PHP domain-containing protein n=1 Tax=Arthrobacter bambusae TaxID=1338426 RepID=UPI002787943A|nr:PHP domain-containing protein [Arthrobacter bambusae]MDQ0213166.1 putative hydrolase [Arthrobacter bambusae]MDQ0237472.1 putative hydrolase [Arthrobacter bambusae]
MDAIDALNETAFWLERELADSFKVQAFRRAAGIIAGLSREELTARLMDGRLKRTKGIGSRTFEVISQALSGAVPDYLENLRRRGAEPLVDGGHELHAKLRGDLHSHSNWSDGGSAIEAMADAAHILGREYLALTDHSPNLTIANGLSPERLMEQLTVVDGINERYGQSSSFRLLTGIEVDILEDGELDQSAELLSQLDVVVASVHSKLRSDKRSMTRRMLAAIENPHTNVLGHCTGRLVKGSRGTRPPSEFDAEKIFASCAEHSVAVEINSRPERQDPPDELIRIALDAGCLFSIDSDAHAPGQLDFLQYGAERAEANGVPSDRIVTTWPLDRLLEWLQPKP